VHATWPGQEVDVEVEVALDTPPDRGVRTSWDLRASAHPVRARNTVIARSFLLLSTSWRESGRPRVFVLARSVADFDETSLR
jgi:hypothetical protein